MDIVPTDMRHAGLGWGALALVLAGCHAGLGAGPALPPASAFTISERAETGPITALAAKAPYLWAAGAAGLRRWDVTTGDAELVGDGDPRRSRGLTALAVDDQGNAWVATADETGRWVAGKNDALTYQTAGSPGDVVALAPRRPVQTQGVWAGGPGGLFRFDGHHWQVTDGLDGAAVTWLGLDEDGVTAWVGTRDKGLYRADDRGARPAPGGRAVGCEQIVGMATTVAGTRVVACNVSGDARVYALTLAGTVELRASVGIHAVALVQRGKEALLLVGPVGRARAYAVRALEVGELLPSGALRLTPASAETTHWAGFPVDLVVPRAVTAAATLGKDLYCGSNVLGVARAAPERPLYLQGSELVGDADRFTVACRAPDQCLVVTDGPRAWQTDGDRYAPVSVGEAADATVLAVAADEKGNTFAASVGPSGRDLTVTKRAAGGGDWVRTAHVSLELPAGTTPKASFAAISPSGELWMGLRAAGGGDQDVGYGAVEIDLQTGTVVQHRPRRAGQPVPVEALPLPADLNGILFDRGAMWFASLSGVLRFQQGQLERWGEAEGLPSELDWAVARGGDGAIWAATSEGIARFDGKSWRPAAGGKLAVHGLTADRAGWLWAATAKGLRIVAGGSPDLERGTVVVPGDMRDLTRDAFGRLWALSTASIALVAPAPPPPAPGRPGAR